MSKHKAVIKRKILKQWQKKFIDKDKNTADFLLQTMEGRKYWYLFQVLKYESQLKICVSSEHFLQRTHYKISHHH